MTPLQAQIATYGVTIPAVAARLLDLPSREARARLDRLVGLRRLFRHPTGSTFYYAASRKPLARDELRRAFGVLWFCQMESPLRRLLSAEELSQVAGEASQLVGQPRVPPETCYIDGGRLCILRVLPSTRDLQHVLAALQRTLLAVRFRPWLLLASRGLVSLTALVEGEDAAGELNRWLQRRPLYGCLSADNVASGLPSGVIAVPTTIRVLRTLRGASKDKSPGGLLS